MPIFERRHYWALAQLMQDAKVQDEIDQQGGLDMLQRMLADLLARDNPSFNRETFVDACEPGTSLEDRAIGES